MPMLPALLLILSAIAYRVITGLAIISGTTWLSNFAPLAAIALCAAAYFPPRFQFTIPFAGLIISDLILNLSYHAPLFDAATATRYLAFALIGCLGLVLRNRPSWRTLLPASIAGSFLFYFLTNTVSWFAEPRYAKTFAGLIQALTIGLPEYSATPTWMFFRNSLLSDLFFTALFVACMNFGRNTGRAAARHPLPHIA